MVEIDKETAMTSRERMTLILRKEIPDRMGLYEHFWGETIPEWQKQGLPKDADPGVYFDYDMINVGGWFDTSIFPGRDELVEETDAWRVAIDSRGAKLKYWKGRSGVPEHVGFEIDTKEKWAAVRDRLLTVERSRLGDLAKAKEGLEAARKSGKYVVYSNLFVFELLRGIIGDENFLPALLLEPEWIRDFCQVYLDHYRGHYEVLFREVGLPDGMFIYEDFGFRNGLFCSPQTMDELIFPYEKQLVGFFHDHGLPVLLHSCGDVRKAVPSIIDAGFDCLQPMEAKAGCDVVELAKTYGRKISYMGNIDVTVLSTNDSAKVEAEVLRKVRAMREMRIPYAFHSDHSVPYSVEFGTYEHAVRVFRENSRYD